ncbi:MAG: hypothetical protein LIP77_06875 [Planctomycetes bacterium]|nr:hypothetical protein [Planctomycetota bacterium]
MSRRTFVPAWIVIAGLAVAAVLGQAATAGDAAPRVNPYATLEGADLLDAINRDHGRPAPRPHVIVDRPWGRMMNPYNDRLYRYNSTGMIDAINRDFPNRRSHGQ